MQTMYFRVGSFRGQLKIQQMAFVLVALMLLFGLVLVFYVSIKTGSIRSSAEEIRELQSKEAARKIVGSPEFMYPAGSCTACADFDKLFVLKETIAASDSYDSFWNTPLIQIKRLSDSEIECTKQNYPNCDMITLYNASSGFSSVSSFIAVCFYDPTINKERCDLGKVVLGVKRT